MPGGSFSGGASRETSKEKGYTNQELDPWIKARLGPSIDRAYGIANQPYQRYGGRRVAGFTPTQTLGRGMALGAAGVTATPRPRTPGTTTTPRPAQPAIPAAPVQTFGVAPAGPAPAEQTVRDVARRSVRAVGGRLGLEPLMADPQTGASLPEPPGYTPPAAQPIVRETQPVRTDPGMTPEPMAGPFGYDEDLAYDPQAAAGAGALNSAIAATQGVLGMRPSSIAAPTGQAAQGRWMGDTPVATFEGAELDPAAMFGGARLGPAPQFEGVRLGDPALIGDVAQAGFERFGGARLGQAAGAEGRDISASFIDRGAVRDAVGGSAADGIGQYLSPYLDEVVGRATADIERQRALQQVGNDSRAAASRAFGSRNDLVAAETNRAALEAAGRTAGELRARGFDVALGASLDDRARALQAQIANIGSDLTILGRNQDATMQAQAANQADTRTVNLANTEAENRFALAQAEFEQQAGINNSNLSGQTSIFNTGQRNEGLFRDADARNRFTLSQAELDQQRGLENARIRTQYGLAQGGIDQEAGLAAAGAINARNLAHGQLRQQAGLAAADAINTGFRSDRGRADALEAANVAARNAFAAAGMDNDLRAQLANQSAGLNYAQLALGAGAQLGGFAATQRANALGDAATVSGLGAGEQALEQAQLDALYEMFREEQQWPFATQQLLNQSLGLLPDVVDTDYGKRGASTAVRFGYGPRS